MSQKMKTKERKKPKYILKFRANEKQIFTVGEFPNCAAIGKHMNIPGNTVQNIALGKGKKYKNIIVEKKPEPSPKSMDKDDITLFNNLDEIFISLTGEIYKLDGKRREIMTMMKKLL